MIVLFAVLDCVYFLNTPLIHQSETLIFEKGHSASRFIDDLYQQHLINAYQRVHLKLWFRFTKADKKMKAGEYAFNQNTYPKQFLEKILKGDSVVHRITLIEGWTFKEMIVALQANPILKQSIPLENQTLIDELGLSNQSPEGLFFPDTYYFVRGMSAKDILIKSKQKMNEVLASLWAKRDPSGALKSPYEGLILASLIEKESAHLSERPLISGVFHLRLKKNMRLQCDPTVIYGLGETYTGKLSTKDLRIDSPYNTYLHAGLPPTPIAAPSLSAIEAAFKPVETDALYFVAKGDGTHTFSATLADHVLAVEKMKQGKQHE